MPSRPRSSPKLSATHETVAIIDFGSQYSQVIARRVREQHVYSVLFPPEVSADELRQANVSGVILSGGPGSVYEPGAPRCRAELLDLGVPVLGICYGMQLGCQLLGGVVQPARAREYGPTPLTIADRTGLFTHLPQHTTVWMSHGDVLTDLPADFVPLARTEACSLAAVRHCARPFFGLQFHPEVSHTPLGREMLRNFLYEICACQGRWRMGDYAEQVIGQIARRVRPDERVICALSGGVDSSVTAALVHRAIGDRLVCILVDNGLLRSGEVELVENTFRDHFAIDLRTVPAGHRFLEALAGVTDPAEKRRRIGHQFIEVFRDEAQRIPGAHYLAQGTLYPDVIESGHSKTGAPSTIKLHHNVGGLPAELGFELIEPLRDLFKDEVRVLGEYLGLPEEIVWRHPFPGPGMAVRILGEVTPERLETARQADRIVVEEITAAGLYRRIAQAFAVLLPVSATGVMGDKRSYEGQQVIAVRLVETEDFMTADWVHLDPDVLTRISSRIINEVPGINRVVYDVSTKPPATIEWE
jgi:GMP synthase (glutamine-hydrolysing)